MGRKPEMWYRKERKAWFVTINGTRHNLGPDKTKATKQFHKLMGEDKPKVQAGSAADILDKFLLWVESNRAPRTYDWYFAHIQSFIDSLPDQSIDAEAVKPHHVTEWVKSSWSKTYTRGAMIAIQRAFKWAVTQGYIGKSPVANLEKPSAERRDNCPTKADYEAMLEHAKGDFKAVLQFAWETGCRPQEITILEARHFKGDRLELMVKESKGKKSKRVIYLTDKAKQILDQNGRVFTNRNGNPWTSYALDCGMKRIAKKTGKKFSFYDLRHGFATRMLEAGLDHFTVAKLMGHKDASMLAKHYSHLGEQGNFLLDKLKSVQ
jgi:integrase